MCHLYNQMLGKKVWDTKKQFLMRECINDVVTGQNTSKLASVIKLSGLHFHKFNLLTFF